MVEIIFHNSYSQVKGLKTDAFRKLKKLLSYESNPNSYFSGGFSRPKSLLDAKGFFPTGLLTRVKNFLNDEGTDFTCFHKTPSFVEVKLEPRFSHTPYAAQLKAVDKAFFEGRGTLSLPTGSGKSLIIALLIDRLRVRTLIVVPNLELKQQLTESLINIFGLNAPITVENIDSKKLPKLQDFDMLIIDEAHHAASATYQKLNKTAWAGIYHRFMLTATPFRNQKDEQLLFEGIAGDVIYKLSYSEAVTQGYIVPVEAYYLECPKKRTGAFTWAQVYSELVVNNMYRNEMIALLMLRLNSENKSSLCLVKEIAHGNILSEMTGIPFANGQDEDSRIYLDEFKSGKLTCLIATTGIAGEGTDAKPCEYVIVAGLGKAKSSFMQQVGRATRVYSNKESAKVIIIYDKSHKFCSRHFAAQRAILKEEYNIMPIKLEIT